MKFLKKYIGFQLAGRLQYLQDYSSGSSGFKRLFIYKYTHIKTQALVVYESWNFKTRKLIGTITFLQKIFPEIKWNFVHLNQMHIFYKNILVNIYLNNNGTRKKSGHKKMQTLTKFLEHTTSVKYVRSLSPSTQPNCNPCVQQHVSVNVRHNSNDSFTARYLLGEFKHHECSVCILTCINHLYKS